MGLPRVRALVIVEGKVLFFKRVRPDQPSPYYSVPGGGMDETDKSEHEALLRELKEELGVESANIGKKVADFLDYKNRTHRIYECSIGRIQLEKRTGEEFSKPENGTYEVSWVPLDEIQHITIRPDRLKDFILENYVNTQRPSHGKA